MSEDISITKADKWQLLHIIINAARLATGMPWIYKENPYGKSRVKIVNNKLIYCDTRELDES